VFAKFPACSGCTATADFGASSGEFSGEAPEFFGSQAMSLLLLATQNLDVICEFSVCGQFPRGYCGKNIIIIIYYDAQRKTFVFVFFNICWKES